MKKLFVMTLAATAMLASCSSDDTMEVPQSKSAITFASFINKSVRATDATLANLGSISVYGWRDADCIFNKQMVTVGTDGKGTYTPVQYWQAGHTYSFEAVAPTSVDGASFTAQRTGGSFNYTNDASIDLLYAKAADVTTASPLTDNPGAVHFTFKHLLSRVKFTFNNTFAATAAAKITISNVKITNAYANGTITPAADGAAWVVSNNTLQVAFDEAATDALKDLAANTGKGATTPMYLIPATSPSYNVEFDVTLNQNGATTTYHHTATITTTMEMGMSYNFVANINASNVDPDNELFPIEFTAEVKEWEDAPDVTITVDTAE